MTWASSASILTLMPTSLKFCWRYSFICTANGEPTAPCGIWKRVQTAGEAGLRQQRLRLRGSKLYPLMFGLCPAVPVGARDSSGTARPRMMSFESASRLTAQLSACRTFTLLVGSARWFGMYPSVRELGQLDGQVRVAADFLDAVRVDVVHPVDLAGLERRQWATASGSGRDDEPLERWRAAPVLGVALEHQLDAPLALDELERPAADRLVAELVVPDPLDLGRAGNRVGAERQDIQEVGEGAPGDADGGGVHRLDLLQVLKPSAFAPPPALW